MATSRTYDHTVSATEIVTDALFKCGGMEEAGSVPPEQMVSGLRQLNNLIKFISTKKGRHLWRRDEVVVFLQPSKGRYLLGPSNTDAEWCLDENFTETKLNGAVVVDATSLTVDSTAGMRAGDRAGLATSATTRVWFAITSIDSATTMTVPAISAAASDDATLYTYTTQTSEVIKIETLVNGALALGVTTIVLDSTTGMADGDRCSYVATDDTTVFTKITTVTNGTDIVVPTTAKAIADNAAFKVYTTTVDQNSITTALNGAASANDETLVLDSTTGAVPGDVISVVATDKSTMWMAIERVVSTTIIAIPPLPSAASDDAVVTIYPLKPPRPQRILHARRVDGPTGVDIPVKIESQEEYRDQPLKLGNGTPVFITYKPTLVSGRMEVWQPPSTVLMRMGLTVERPFENIDAGANNPDFPQEWYDPLVFILADRLEIEYRVLDQLRVQALSNRAEEMWEWVNNFDDDTGSIYILPEFDGSEGYGP